VTDSASFCRALLDAAHVCLVPGSAFGAEGYVRLSFAAGLDELPQILNVLRGDMSLVGPRPCIRYECERYAPWHWQRFEVVPGLTGLWQVIGKNRTTFDEMVRLDIEYSQRRSVGLDLQIILRTLPALWQQYHDLRPAKTKEQTGLVGFYRSVRSWNS